MKNLLAAPVKKFQAIVVALLFLVAGLFIGARVALDNAILVSDLDADGHKILNLPSDQPLPPPVEGATIPPAWLGTTATTAAQGNLAEFKSNKGVASGYASLDSGGKVPSAQLPSGVGLGTVTSVGVTTANGVSATGGPITGSGSFTFSLGNISPTTVNITGSGGSGYLYLTLQSTDPTVVVSNDAALWVDSGGKLSFKSGFGTSGHVARFGALSLSADQTYFLPDTSGALAMLAQIPTQMVGVGGGHKGGLVIDTGASGTASDYLGRDAAWHPIPTAAGPTYQPQVPPVTISPSTNTTGARNITLSDSLTGTSIFYEIGASAGPFIPYTGTVSLPAGSIIYTYGAKAGYTNSAMANYTNPNP